MIKEEEAQQEEDDAQLNEAGESEEEDDPPLNESGELEETWVKKEEDERKELARTQYNDAVAEVEEEVKSYESE
ncbi:hypothetical protein YC2023_043887 [Brassica napus]